MKKIIYNILEFIIPFLPNINIKLWTKTCLYKHKLAKELNIYDIYE